MKASELITGLQALIAEHGDVPVYYADEDGIGGETEVANVDFGTHPEEGIYLCGPCATPRPDPRSPMDQLLAGMKNCPVDHWSWNPEHVERDHGALMRCAGITDLNAWVDQERVKLAMRRAT